MLATSRVIINRPVKTVWEFFDNPDNLSKWLTGFKRFEHISGTPGKPGAKSKQYYEMNGRSIEMLEEITVRKECEEFSGIISNKWMTSTTKNTFHDLGDGRTELVSSVESAFKPFFLKLLGSIMMRKGFQQRQDADLEKLKEVLESGGS